MPRLRHNDAGDPDLDVCSTRGCGHIRKRHCGGANGKACTGEHLDPFTNLGRPCACPWFVKRDPRTTRSHRDGDVVHMNLRWDGQHPVVGEFLASQLKPRYAYRIDDIYVRRTRVRDSDGILEITATKIPIGKLPPGAVVHPLKWDSRKQANERVNGGWGR